MNSDIVSKRRASPWRGHATPLPMRHAHGQPDDFQWRVTCAANRSVRQQHCRGKLGQPSNGGASSAQLWHDSPWLDFNMAQTWDAYQNIYPALLRDYERLPVKPCGLGEGAYEDGPQYPTKPINALVIRKQSCWSWFASGYHTYGNGNVWYFDTCKPELTQTWTAALQSPGAASLRHAKRFLTTIEWWKYVPDASLFAEGEGSGGTRNVAMRSSDAEGDAIAVYFASPATVKLRLDKIAAGCKFAARWTNPATGEERSAGTFDRQPRSFTPPSGWSDALLHVAAKSQKPK